MNREDIIRMAREAGLNLRGHYDEPGSTPQELERFFHAAYAAGAAAEPKGGGRLPPPLQAEPVAWRCACGANLYIDADGAPRARGSA